MSWTCHVWPLTLQFIQYVTCSIINGKNAAWSCGVATFPKVSETNCELCSLARFFCQQLNELETATTPWPVLINHVMCPYVCCIELSDERNLSSGLFIHQDPALWNHVQSMLEYRLNVIGFIFMNISSVIHTLVCTVDQDDGTVRGDQQKNKSSARAFLNNANDIIFLSSRMIKSCMRAWLMPATFYY